VVAGPGELHRRRLEEQMKASEPFDEV
jgi:hypothetical protein